MNKIQIALIGLALIAVTGCSPSPNSANTTNTTGSSQSSSTPVAEAPKFTEAEVHVPLYPGSTMINDKSMIVKNDTEESVLVYLSSIDDVKKIADFYQDKVKGLNFNVFKDGEAVNYIGEAKSDDGAKIAVAIVKKKTTDPVEISIGWGKETKK